MVAFSTNAISLLEYSEQNYTRTAATCKRCTTNQCRAHRPRSKTAGIKNKGFYPFWKRMRQVHLAGTALPSWWLAGKIRAIRCTTALVILCLGITQKKATGGR